MNRKKLIILVIALIGVLAVFMPWISLPLIGSINGARGIGLLILGLYAVSAVICMLDDRTKPLTGDMRYAAVAPAALSSLIAIWKIISVSASMPSTEDNPFAEAMSSAVSIGFGLFLVVLAGIAITAVAFLMKEPKTE